MRFEIHDGLHQAKEHTGSIMEGSIGFFFFLLILKTIDLFSPNLYIIIIRWSFMGFQFGWAIQTKKSLVELNYISYRKYMLGDMLSSKKTHSFKRNTSFRLPASGWYMQVQSNLLYLPPLLTLAMQVLSYDGFDVVVLTVDTVT